MTDELPCDQRAFELLLIDAERGPPGRDRSIVRARGGRYSVVTTVDGLPGRA